MIDQINAPDVSRPLPVLRVERPSTARGIPGVRAHLDAKRCWVCDCPDAPTKWIDAVGTRRRVRECQGHPNEKGHRGVTVDDPKAEAMWFCERCGRARPCREQRICTGCRYYERWGYEAIEYYHDNRRVEIIEAAEELGIEPGEGSA